MIFLVSIGGFILFTILAFLVGVLKKINIAPSITEVQIKKVRKKDIFARDVSVHLFFLGVACLMPYLLGLLLGKVGTYVGLAILILGALLWSSFTGSIDRKIKVGKY
ncbi:MAG: hypothetical protein ACRDCB_14450 [Clostridium sp.]|uniref:hypothetical protein n=1 Tax=Clostridium TaxID=1485 RepID=UPI0021523F24|nr:hypothetical protein [Clostridium sp. LY3-2]MCR6513893.1 hypothetical protein [Clostridium sp. LY3-2]